MQRMRRTRRPRGRPATIAWLAALAVLATACNHDQELESRREFAACMRDQGLDFPDPVRDQDGGVSGPAGPLDGDWEAFEAARRNCEAETGHQMD
jgi:hypothetical protein